MPVPLTKPQLRAELRTVRRSVAADPLDRAARSGRMWDRVIPLLPPGGSRILLFESLPTEPDTAAWIQWCRDREAEVFFPHVDGLDLRIVPGDIDPQTLDVAIVPGLGFTADGRRLGQGGGHYDRLLARMTPSTLAIGVCYVEQLLDDLPTEAHDRRVDIVVTDRRSGSRQTISVPSL